MVICIFGDSITWGAYDRQSGGWADRLKIHFFNQDLETNVYNYGIPGDKVKDIVHRFDLEASLKKPDKIIFAAGQNDTPHASRNNSYQGTPIKEFKDQLTVLLEKAEKLTRDVTIIGLFNVDEEIKDYSYKNEEIKKYDKIVKEIANERNLVFVETFGLLTKENLFIDGLHPDANGHKKIFEKVLSAINSK